MDRAKILNLLDTMEMRIDRMEKALAPSASKSANAVLQILIELRAAARRVRSKIDSMDAGSTTSIREKIDEIRGFSSASDLEFRLNVPGYEGKLAREALIEDTDFLLRLTNGMLIGLQLTADGVRDLLPAQKPAAFRFGYDNDNKKIVLVNEPFRPADKEAGMAIAALDEMISQGEEVNSDLQMSNASPRLKSAFARVQARLVSHTNIVQAGLSNQSAARALRGSVDELSAGHFEQLRSYVEGVSSVLAQFPEWRLFSQNAVAADLDRSAVAELTADSLLLAQQLTRSGYASDQVPKALEQIVAWTREEEQPDARDVLSLARTWENIWSFLTKNALAKAIVDEGLKVIARKIIASVLKAIGYGFVAILARVPGAEWVEPTFEFLKSNIQNLLPK